MVDIIIPVYNTPKTELERCFRSVLHQTYTQWRLTIVDDGSAQELAQWLESVFGKTKNIQIIHTENGGVSKARNLGLTCTSEKYVVFCDADDALTSDFLEHAVSLMEHFQLDLVVGGHCQICQEKKQEFCCQMPMDTLWLYEENQIYNAIDYMLTGMVKKENKEFGEINMGSVWAKVYRRSVFGEIRFDNSVKMCEDVLFNLEYMLCCNKVGMTSEIWYTYYRNDYSATMKARTVIASQQVVFSDAINNIRPRLKTEQLENALNICLFWKMEYCLRTAYLEKTCIKKLGNVMALPPFAKAGEIHIREYVGMRLRIRILFALMKCPTALRPWQFWMYYVSFYTLSKLKNLFTKNENFLKA